MPELDRITRVLLQRFMRKTIRKLTFTYSINVAELYTIAHYCTVKDDIAYAYSDSPKHYRRFQNILSKINSIDDVDSMNAIDITDGSIYSKPKIFDEIIKEKNIQLYNSIATKIQAPLITCTPSENVIKNSLLIEDEESKLDYNAAEIMFPYAFIGERVGTNIIETMALVLLYSTVHHKKRLDKLNSDPQGNYKYSFQFLRNLIIEAQSPQYMYEFALLFLSYFQIILYEYLDKMEDLILKTYMLDDKYRSRKDVKRAFKNTCHHISSKKLQEQLSSVELGAEIFEIRSHGFASLCETYSKSLIFCEFLLFKYYFEFIPRDKTFDITKFEFNDAKEIIAEFNKENQDDRFTLTEWHYNVACEMASVIIDFIANATSRTLEVFQKLPEFNFALDSLHKIAIYITKLEPAE